MYRILKMMTKMTKMLLPRISPPKQVLQWYLFQKIIPSIIPTMMILAFYSPGTELLELIHLFSYINIITNKISFKNHLDTGGFCDNMKIMNNIHLQHIETTGPLPTSNFDLYDRDLKVGFCQLRHTSNCAAVFPENMKSHVYYEIDSAFQGKGYGNKILDLVKDEARKIGLSEIYLTAWDTNIPSIKIIIKNGGEYLWDYIDSEGKRLEKYKIIL